MMLSNVTMIILSKMRWLDSIGDPMDMNLSKRSRTGNPGVLHSMTSQRVGHDLVTEQQHV